MTRVRLNDDGEGRKPLPNFFSLRNPDLELISSGCTLLDCVLGGGWVLGRIGNVVGDKSTGKSLLAIEACTNFAMRYQGPIYYREAEAAFDEAYAGALGMPLDRVDFGSKDFVFHTVEDFFDDLNDKLKGLKKSKEAGLYIVDSLDALSDDAEMARKITEDSFNLTKQKKMGELFRKLVREVEASRTCLIIVSQVRDKIGISFGKKQSRSGGKALDFYASQILWLSHMGILKRQFNKIERATGIRIKAKAEKNKVGLPFRECEFEVMFGYGIDSNAASLTWLADVGKEEQLLKDAGMSSCSKYLKWMDGLEGRELRKANRVLEQAVIGAWAEVEFTFLPQKKKYS